jgi:secretion system chaperone SscA
MMEGSDRGMPHDDLEVLRTFFASGGSLRMLADIDRKDVDMLFAYAQQLFEGGDLRTACRIFLILVRIDHWDFDCWLLLGKCYQRLGAYDESIFCFSRSGMIIVDDPRPAYFAGISYRLTGNEVGAIKAFQAALRWCGDREDFWTIKKSVMQQIVDCGGS